MTLLEEAAAIVKVRRQVYAPPYDQHKIAADMFNAWKGTALTSADAAMFMIMIKISRLAKTPDHADTILDIAGYTDVYQECVVNNPEALEEAAEAERAAMEPNPEYSMSGQPWGHEGV